MEYSDSFIVKRRILIAGLSTFPFSAIHAQWKNQAPPDPNQIVQQIQQKPVEPYIKLNDAVWGDERIVRTFFDFKCPFCANMHDSMFLWGSSLPKGYEHIFVPVTQPRDTASMFASMAFYQVAQRLSNADLNEFMMRAYNAFQSSSNTNTAFAQDLKWWASIAKTTIKNDKNLQQRVEKAAILLKAYQVVSTPTIGLGGRYTITPEITQGNRSMFTQLLNAVFSMVIDSNNRR